MSRPVFISYSRGTSAPHARALAESLGDLVFLDTSGIDDGDQFPQHLLEAILDSSVVVIFATKVYSERRFCRLEMRLALAGGDAAGSHIVLALGEGCDTVLDAMPAAIASHSWPAADAAERLDALVHKNLGQRLPAIRARLSPDEAKRLASAFLEESKLPEPQSLLDIVCSFPPGVSGQSIGARFVGRADLLCRIHLVLSEGTSGAAQLTSRITAGAGFGKTRLTVEYVHRYGPRYYPGGIFWVDAGSSAIEGELWRVLSALDPNVPNLAEMRGQGRDVQRELERALRKIDQPALYVIDNIPEADHGADPPAIAAFCPAIGAVTVLANSRQDTREENVTRIPVDALGCDSAILLLTDTVSGAATLSWAEWGRIVEWVGDLPLALDLLNRSLALGSISPRDLLNRVHSTDQPPSATGELDRLREGLRGQVPKNAVRGVTETFSISIEKLDGTTQQLALLLAQLASAPIPEAFMEALPDELRSPAIRAALRSRHFVTSSDDLSFGVMHRLMADFLRRVPEGLAQKLFGGACTVLRKAMPPDRCRDPRHWPVMRLCRPHAEALFARGSAVDVMAMESSELGSRAAMLAWAQGEHAGAQRLWERVLEVTKRVLGDEHPDTLPSMGNLALALLAEGDHWEARRLQERVLEVTIRVRGEDHRETLTSMSNLAMTLAAQGDHVGARRLQERVLKVNTRVLGEEHPDTLTAMNNLSGTLGAQGDHVGARRVQERVRELSTRVLGEEHPDTLTSMDNLACTLREQGDHAEARRLQERVLGVMTRVLGERHPDTLAAMNNLAETVWAQGDHAGAGRLWERVLEVRKNSLGDEHPDTLASMGNMALTLLVQGDHAGARRLQERVLEMNTHVLGEEHSTTLTSMGNMAWTLLAQGDHAGARQLQERVLEVSTRVLGEKHSDTLRAMNNLSGTLGAQGDHAAARTLQEQVLEASTRVLGEEHPNTLTSMNNLALTLGAQGDIQGALRLLRKCDSGRRKVLGEDQPATVATTALLKRLEAQLQDEPPSAQPG
jgi:tetratricopeptide (TPR) repeat protein